MAIIQVKKPFEVKTETGHWRFPNRGRYNISGGLLSFMQIGGYFGSKAEIVSVHPTSNAEVPGLTASTSAPEDLLAPLPIPEAVSEKPEESEEPEETEEETASTKKPKKVKKSKSPDAAERAGIVTK